MKKTKQKKKKKKKKNFPDLKASSRSSPYTPQ